MPNYIIEIATSDFLTTQAAVAGGADRIELCANLAEGGTTPSYGHIKHCVETFTSVDIFPIIRPRGGDFLYTEPEIEIMARDIMLCKSVGCGGVVLGLLQADGSIDVEQTSRLVELAYPMEVTFHRAFDRCKNPFEALEQLIDIGCSRILTSGQALTVNDGMDTIAALNKQADGRIIILPGSGLRKENIKALAEKTGCIEFHTSLRAKTKSEMNFINPAFAVDSESYYNNAIDSEEVKALRAALA